MKLEAGKAYVFKDDFCMDLYFNSDEDNYSIYSENYSDGFTLDTIDLDGSGWGMLMLLIGADEIEFFKLKEEKVEVKEFTKADLKTGMILEYNTLRHNNITKSGLVMVLLGTENGDIMSGDIWMPLSDITKDLIVKSGNTTFDKVYQPSNNKGYLSGGINLSDCELIWERQPPRETIEINNKRYYKDELCKALENINPID